VISNPDKLLGFLRVQESLGASVYNMPIKDKIISIVDNELSTTNLFYKVLQTISGIDVLRFTNPIEALDHLKMNKDDYAVMISDLRMPVINGVQLLQTVKDLNPLSRTILITAYDIDGSLLQEYTEKEIIDCFLQKPVGIDQLRSVVTNQLTKC
jgi:two-component SAPR family response regulator